MKINTKLKIIAILPVSVLLIVGLVLFLTSQQINKAKEKADLSDALIKDMFEMNLLLHEYLLYHGERSQTQWQLKHDSMGKVLMAAEFKDTEGQSLLEGMRRDYQEIKVLFSQVVAMEGIAGSEELHEISVRRILVKTLTMVSNAKQLSVLNHAKVITVQRRADLVIVIFLAISSVVLIVVLFSISENLTRHISKFGEGVEIIAGGNFDYKVGIDTKDEIGWLSRSFDDMVSRLKESQTQLRDSEQKFRNLIESTPTGIAVSTPEGRVIEANPSLYKLLGYESEEEFLSLPATAYWHNPEERKKFRDELIEKGMVKDFEVRVRCKDGSILWVNVNTVAQKTENGVICITSFLDITERKHYEEETKRLNEELAIRAAKLETANKDLEDFSYSVSHDLRTPLRAVDGFSNIILEDYWDKLDDEGRRVLNTIRDNTKKMGQLIDDILVFSRTGRMESVLSEIDMEALTKEIIEELKATFLNRNIHFDIKPLPSARGDRAMIRRVVTNLISNAIKFTRPKEAAVVEVGVTRDEGRGRKDEEVYYIKDNGIGFDMQYYNKLFGVFQRLHSSAEFEGTGIGLAIVKRIIEKHGGRVWADGKVDEGATFYFTLPKLSAVS